MMGFLERLAPRERYREVSADDYGSRWPLAVDHGVLVLDTKTKAVTLEHDGTTYALNGIARMQDKGEEVHAIWEVVPGAYVGTDPVRKDLGPLIQDGLRLAQGVRR